MQIDSVNMFDKQVHLLKPIELDGNQKIFFHYNYFEDDFWETALYDSKNCSFHSQKKGGREFSDVILAIYVLYELYSEGCCLVIEDGDLIDASSMVGWINYVLGTNFSVEHRFALWKNAELLSICYKDFVNVIDFTDMFDIIPAYMFQYAGGEELADLINISDGTSSLANAELEKNTYQQHVLFCKFAIEKWLKRAIQ